VGYQEISVKRSPAVEKPVLQPIRKGLMIALPRLNIGQDFIEMHILRLFTDSEQGATILKTQIE
jgi:hypothetical protein